MTKAEFLDQLARDERIGSKKAAGDAVDAVLDAITDVLERRRGRQLHRLRQVPRRRARPAPGRQPPHRRADHDPRRQGAALLGRLGAEVQGQGLSRRADASRSRTGSRRSSRSAAARSASASTPIRRSSAAAEPEGSGDPGRRAAAAAVAAHCRELIERAGPACVAVKPQLACFERLGAPGWAALGRGRASGPRGRPAGDRRRQARRRAGHRRGLRPGAGRRDATPWGAVAGLGADAFTANPLLGGDALEPLVEAAADGRRRRLRLVRTSNPGAADLQDLDAGGAPLHERLAGARRRALAPRLAGEGGLSGMGAVVGATEPRAPRPPARADAALDLPDPRGRRAGRAARGPGRRVRRRARRLGAGRGLAQHRRRPRSRRPRPSACATRSGKFRPPESPPGVYTITRAHPPSARQSMNEAAQALGPGPRRPRPRRRRRRAIVVVLATSPAATDSTSGKHAGKQPDGRQATSKGEQAIARASPTWSRRATPSARSPQKTGVALDALEQLNPDIDPQILIAGEQLKLR